MTRLETMEHVFAPTADPDWVLLVDGYNSLREASVESRFAISNGFLGVRGARSTTRGGRWVVPARTYVAGLFDTSGEDHVTRGLIPGRGLVAGTHPAARRPLAASSWRHVVASDDARHEAGRAAQ